MKKIIFILVAIFMTFALTACSENLVNDSLNSNYSELLDNQNSKSTSKNNESPSMTTSKIVSSSKSSSTTNSVSSTKLTSTSNSTNSSNSKSTASTSSSKSSSSSQSTTELPDYSSAIQISVDASFSGTNGTVVSGFKTYKTITLALESLKSVSASSKKVIFLKEGTYKEKITIANTMTNLEIVGSTSGISKITYGDYAGKLDSNGAKIGTDASATITILAENFISRNVSFENSFSFLKPPSGVADKQAVAVVAKADKLAFYNCSFYGYQDTLEAVLGRQYYKDCLIAGCTDFIFGNNAASLFDNCEILSRKNGTNGGYIAVAKGNNNTNGQQVPKFGFVFLNCKLTGESGMPSGKTSLARPWRKDATVAYINCEMAGHISKAAYDGSNGGKRYVYMNGGKDSAGNTIKNEPQNAHFVEFGNIGAGAITQAVKGCTMLNATQASEYTAENIFATTNGMVTYKGNWNPASAN